MFFFTTKCRRVRSRISRSDMVRRFLVETSALSIKQLFYSHQLIAILVVVMSFAPGKLSAQSETVESLVDETRVLDSPYELHLTSDNAPLVNSTVNLTHEDAWLFFDNIRPSAVLSSYAGSIYINGESLSNGVNGRVAIYAHGTVIMPHGSTFKPLTVYTEENYGGNSRQFELHTYHSNLGEFNNEIRSLVLKRGYQATFATNSDGSGYSRVFIADKEDLEFNIMPDEFNGTISFIRVFKHQWVTKKGWCGWSASDISMANVTCYYDWNVGGTTTSNYEYSPIRQNAGWPSWVDINAKQNVSHLLGFNEPDRPDQSDMTFQQIMNVWPGMMQSGLRIGSPAWSNPWGGNGGNLFDFIAKCDELNYRVDFVALHCYWGGKSPQAWYDDLKYLHEATGRPLWITEWNNGANWTNEWWPDDTWELTPDNAQKQLDDLTGILEVLDTAHFVERYFIYNWVEDRRAIILNGALTPAGEYYAASKSQIAYNSVNDVVPGWNYLLPELSYSYASPSKSVRLEWTNPNGDLCKNYKIEKRIENGSYEEIYYSEDMSELTYNDTIEGETSTRTSYKITFVNVKGETLKTNEVHFYQTEGSNTTQTGSFKIYSSDWSTSAFSESYEATPIVLLGVPTFHNKMPITSRVEKISINNFSFHLEPWAYLNNPSFTQQDSIPILALQSGAYSFEGLKAEADLLKNVYRDWISVQFDEEFSEAPAVFATIVSDNSPYPLTVAIQNVTAQGFEICLKTEEKNTGIILAENVSFLAIEPGIGRIDGKRIVVGTTFETGGISTSPLDLTVDPSFTEPVVFGNLLTSNDVFASTLRCSKEDNTISIEKQREMSASISAPAEDHVSWMIIDIAAGQSSSIDENSSKLLERRIIYPNPVEDVIYFNLDRTIDIEIFDLKGRKLLEAKEVNQLDINHLPSGIYNVVIEKNTAVRFIKK